MKVLLEIDGDRYSFEYEVGSSRAKGTGPLWAEVLKLFVDVQQALSRVLIEQPAPENPADLNKGG